MACVLTSGRTEPCRDAIGGLKLVYLIDRIADPFTVSGGQATAINGSISAVYQYDLDASGNTLVETINSDRDAGTTTYEQVLSLVLKKQTQASATELALVIANGPVVVVKDRYGNHRAIGISDGTVVTGDIQSGGAKADFNGYNLTFTATEVLPAPTLDSSTVTALEALISGTTIDP